MSRRALITGGGTGIGRGIALELAGHGYALAVTGRRRAPLEEVVAEIAAMDGHAVAIDGDVSDPESCRDVVRRAVEALGGVDILVNNAGVARGGPVDGPSDEEIDLVIDVDLKGPLHMIRAALPELDRQTEPRSDRAILNISSSVTLMALPDYSLYSAAKAGLDMLTRCLALELAPRGIRVNAVCPGVVETPIFETMMPADQAAAMLGGFGSNVPLGRIGQPADVARAVRFLCDPENDWITGAVVPVDGGLSLGPS